MSINSVRRRIQKLNDRICRASYYPYFKSLDQASGSHLSLGGETLVSMSSNDYLGLSLDRRVIEASQKALAKYGTSRCSSRLLNGTAKIHEEAEEALSDFFGKERSLLFTTGHQANLGVFQSLLGKGDTLLLDKDCHASIYDGAVLSGSMLERFTHNDFHDAKNRYQRLDESPALVATEGIFSMDGSIPNLGTLLELFGDAECLKVLDEAHSIGIMGSGRGAAAEYGVIPKIDILTGTFSKSLASVGGFISASSEMIEYIRNSARSLIFTAAPAPSAVAAAMKALEIIATEQERIHGLRSKIAWFKEELSKIGILADNSVSPIIPLKLSSVDSALNLCIGLRDLGFLSYPIVPPASPQGTCMLRISVTSSHTDGDLSRFLEALEKLKISEYIRETA